MAGVVNAGDGDEGGEEVRVDGRGGGATGVES